MRTKEMNESLTILSCPCENIAWRCKTRESYSFGKVLTQTSMQTPQRLQLPILRDQRVSLFAHLLQVTDSRLIRLVMRSQCDQRAVLSLGNRGRSPTDLDKCRLMAILLFRMELWQPKRGRTCAIFCRRTNSTKRSFSKLTKDSNCKRQLTMQMMWSKAQENHPPLEVLGQKFQPNNKAINSQQLPHATSNPEKAKAFLTVNNLKEPTSRAWLPAVKEVSSWAPSANKTRTERIHRAFLGSRKL